VRELELYEWQKEAISVTKNQNAVVSAPTGSGKTLVAYAWAGLFPLVQKEVERVIFTAPIKALSNERFLDLKKKNVDVGIITGDIKYNGNAYVLCMTQEIYTEFFAHKPNQLVVIDEFHYVTSNPQRARTYVEGVRRTHPSSKLLVMSATFGDPEGVRKYVERLANRKFVLYHTNFRATSLEFIGEVTPEKVAEKGWKGLWFVFSRNGCEGIAFDLASLELFPKPDKEVVRNIARKYNLSDTEIFPTIWEGIGVYYGTMLPKEKFFVEDLFRKQIISQVVGTDSLALGVNLPADVVVFCQLAKYYEGPISKVEFLQMAGRAGRKNYTDAGYVGYYPTRFEAFDYDTASLYDELVEADIENFFVDIEPDIRAVLRGERAPKEEAEIIAISSIPPLDEEEKKAIEDNIRSIVEKIHSELTEKEILILKEIYFSELPVLSNILIARIVNREGKLDLMSLFNNYSHLFTARTVFELLLQIKRFGSFDSRKSIKIHTVCNTIINIIPQIPHPFIETRW